ncbi:MAG: YhdP family protein [Spiribacter sp.]|nr:YhdP family protein [Spiribacter sp.]
MRIAKWLNRWLWPQQGERLKAAVVYGVVGILVSAALLLSGIRLVIAMAPSLTSEVEARVSEQLGVPVTMADLDARLDGLRPGLLLKDVRVGASDAAGLRLDALQLAIAPWESLQAGALRLHSLRANGLDVTLQRQANGRWQGFGLLPGGQVDDLSAFLRSLRRLPVDHLLISQSTLRLRDQPSDAELVFTPVALRWRRDEDGEWRFALDARDGDQHVRARLQLEAGNVDSAKGFINLSNVQGARWAAFLNTEMALPPASTVLNGDVWLSMNEAGIERVSANIKASSLDGFGGLGSASAAIWVSRQAGAWQGIIRPRSITDQSDRELTLGPIAVARSFEADAPWRVSSQGLPLAWVAELTASPSLPAEALSGRIAQMQAVWQSPTSWRAQGHLKSLALEAEAARPALRADSATIMLGPKGGRLNVQNAKAQIDPPDLLRNPINIEAFSGQLEWSQTSTNGLRMRLAETHAQWLGQRLSLSGDVWVPPDASVWLDMQAHYAGAPAKAVLAHLPVGVMHEQLPGWLDRAIIDGEIAAATLRLLGPIDNFPFDQGQGVFDLRTALNAVEFTYNPKWPGFTQAEAELRFRNRAMSIAVADARVADVALNTATARIEDLWAPQLAIQGQFSGALPKMKAYLQSTPLPAAQSLDGVTIRGDGQLDLDVFVPFRRQPPAVSGQLQLDGADLQFDAFAASFTGIQGAVAFDDDGVSAQGLRAKLLDSPVVAQVSTEGEGPQARIRLDAKATLAIQSLPGFEALDAYSQGAAQWRARWERPGFQAPSEPASQRSRLTLRSDLSGTALALPFGLDKPADQARATQVTWQWGGDPTQSIILSHGERLQVHSRWQPDGEARLGVHFGGQAAVLPVEPVTHVTGALPVVALANLTENPMSEATSWQRAIPPLSRVEVALEGMDIARWRVGATEMAAQASANGWDVELQGSADGTAQWLADERQLTLDLSRLEIKQPVTPDEPAPTDEKRDSGTQPNISLNAESFVAAGTELGALEFALLSPTGIAEQARIRLRGERAELDVLAEPDAEGSTLKRLRFELYSDDAGAVLTGLGLPRAMRKGVGEASGDLTWQGPLLSPDKTSLAGSMQVDLRNGSLLAIEPGPGRALGLFSLSVLPRRIGLDFSDVVGEGLSFDSLQGSWDIDEGIMSTDDLSLEGPSLNLAVAGETDLVRERYDQQVLVTPRLSSALTFFGGLAGGPVAAVMLFFTRDMIEPGVERLTELEYRIVGPWEDPRFELLSPLQGGDEQGVNPDE